MSNRTSVFCLEKMGNVTMHPFEKTSHLSTDLLSQQKLQITTIQILFCNLDEKQNSLLGNPNMNQQIWEPGQAWDLASLS